MFDEATTQSGLHINEIGKSYLMMRASGLSERAKHDFRLQVGGDLSRFEELITIISRFSSNDSQAHASTLPVMAKNYYGDGDWFSDEWAHQDHWVDDGSWASDGWDDDGSSGSWWTGWDDDDWQDVSWDDGYDSCSPDGAVRLGIHCFSECCICPGIHSMLRRSGRFAQGFVQHPRDIPISANDPKQR